jgi:hypothetical protein
VKHITEEVNLLVLKDSVNIRMYPPHMKGIFSIRKMRTRHIAVTGNHLSRSYQNIFRNRLLRSLYWRRRALHHSKRVMIEKRSGISKTCRLINFFTNLNKIINCFFIFIFQRDIKHMWNSPTLVYLLYNEFYYMVLYIQIKKSFVISRKSWYNFRLCLFHHISNLSKKISHSIYSFIDNKLRVIICRYMHVLILQTYTF